jgi:radical SAM superfamily enzyme YgiQ (UPF0313 family)
MSRILLLNPPGTRPYLRDYYCSKVSKANYLYEPVDLLILSGLLTRRHQVQVLDCIALGLDGNEALRRILDAAVEVVIFLSGAVSWHEDRPFLQAVKQASEALLIGSGDLFLQDGDRILAEHDFVDAVLLDFTTAGLLSYLERPAGAQPENMIFRQGEEIVHGPVVRSKNTTFEIPPPRHDLFPHHSYSYPTVKRAPFATVQSDYGCPYHCRFCVMGGLGHKVRSAENVLAELEILAGSGFREIYFNDQTFGVLRQRTLALCEGMETRRLGLAWQAWTRVDLVDEEILKRMRAAGCHTLLFGVESANHKTLRTQNKGYGLGQVKRAFALCRSLGIRTLATYIIGLPGETEADIRRTIDFAVELDSDLASFNVLVPRAGTEVRREALQKGWIRERDTLLDQSGTYPIMGNEHLSSVEVWRLKNRAVRAFYGRPGYWLRRLRQIDTGYELRRNLTNGWILLRNMVINRADKPGGVRGEEGWL